MGAPRTVVDDFAARLKKYEEDAERARQALACYPHDEDGGDDVTGATACMKARSYPVCEQRQVWEANCPIRRLDERFAGVEKQLVTAGVETRERDIILADARWHNREPLLDTDALRVVRAVLGRKRQTVPLVTSSAVDLVGDEAIIALCGPRGVGKSIAACWALGQLGGRYTTAYQFVRPGLDLDDLKRTPLVVIDQLGRQYAASDYGPQQLEEVLDSRHAGRRPTIVVGKPALNARAR